METPATQRQTEEAGRGGEVSRVTSALQACRQGEEVLGSVAYRVGRTRARSSLRRQTLVTAVLSGIHGIAAFVRRMWLEYSMGTNVGVRYHFLDKMPIR